MVCKLVLLFSVLRFVFYVLFFQFLLKRMVPTFSDSKIGLVRCHD